MSFSQLESEYIALLGGQARIVELANPCRSVEGENLLLQYMEQAQCRYFLSKKFERCGMPVCSSEDLNFSNFLHSATCEAAFRAEESDLADFDAPVLVGLSPYGDFGAEVMRVDSGYLVLISSATLSFCMVYAILAVSSMQIIGQLSTDIKNEILSGNFSARNVDPYPSDAMSSLQALKSMVEELSATGTLIDPEVLVASSGFGSLHPVYYERVQAAYEHFIVFLILHEFGHIALGHMNAADKVMRSVPVGDRGYKVLDPLPRQEEEADDYALKALVGENFHAELLPLLELLHRGDLNNKELNKLWAGHTAYGRYISALLLMRGFNLMDSCYLRDLDSGVAFTGSCEINGTHPSGQHRFIRALTRIQKFIPLPEGSVNAGAVLDWSNFVGAICRR